MWVSYTDNQCEQKQLHARRSAGAGEIKEINMTYKELYESAIDKLEKSKITLGEFEKMIEPLNAEIDTDSDTISRQAAISAICNACGKIDCDKMDKCEKLQLPHANSSEIPNSSDTISRQQAIDICRAPHMRNADCSDFEMAIMMLPPAQPERIKGHWIKISPANIYECSECGKSVMTNDICAYDFCHGCGAKMREVTT